MVLQSLNQWQKIKGLGVVSNETDIGIFAHPILAVDPKDNFVLGLASLKIWSRNPIRKKSHEKGNRKEIKIEERESYRWLESANESKDILKNCAKVTVVSDREADFYALYYMVPDNKTDLIVRSKAKRFVEMNCGENELELSEYLSLRKVKDQKEILVPRQSGSRINTPPSGKKRYIPKKEKKLERSALVDLKFEKVTILRPKNFFDENAPIKIELTVIDVCENSPQEESEKIHWLLLTTHPASTVDQAWEIVSWYKKRWFIESLFKTVKSAGMNIEKMELTKSDPIMKFSVLMLVSAVKILQLTLCRDLNIVREADLVFENDEIEVLEKLEKKLEGKTEKQKNPYTKKSVAWSHWILARLGGWMGYSSEGPAGSQIMRRGLERFYGILEGFLLRKDLCID